MNFYMLLCSIMLSIPSVFSQELEQAQPDTEELTRYHIGVGNEEASAFSEILINLRADSGVELTAICEAHQLLTVSVNSDYYKSYDVLRDHLLSLNPDLLLFRKNDGNFPESCKEEQLKH